MNPLDLKKIEAEFEVRLPQAYKDFLLNYPRDLTQLKRDLGWKQEAPSARELLASVKALRSVNSKVRLPGTPWVGEDDPWPVQYWVIGDNEAGDYWCIDVANTAASVYFYDHDRGAFEKRFKSVSHFADFLRDSIKSWNAQQS